MGLHNNHLSSIFLPMSYRLYLLDTASSIVAADYFEAETDTLALRMSAVIHAACRDVVSGYELWHGMRRIGSDVALSTVAPETLFDQATQAQQDAMLDLESRLHDSFALLRRSRGLLDIMARRSASPGDGAANGGAANDAANEQSMRPPFTAQPRHRDGETLIHRARRLVLEARERLDSQRRLTERLRSENQPAKLAESLLDQLEQALRVREEALFTLQTVFDDWPHMHALTSAGTSL